MNSPSAATPSCQSRLVRTHQRRNNAIPPAYDLVVNSEPSRPNRTWRKNASASSTTARFSSSTVQYRTPDGNLTGNARTLISSLAAGTCTTTSHEHHSPGDLLQNRPVSPIYATSHHSSAN